MQRPKATETGRNAGLGGGRAGSHPHKVAGLGYHAGWGPSEPRARDSPKADETGRYEPGAENPVRCKLF